jgi:hypothetical protein
MLALFAILALPVNSGKSGKKDQLSDLPKTNNENQGAPAASFVHNETSSPDKETSKAEPPHWYASPEWWLCILGVPTLIIIGWQANETRKAAGAALLNAQSVLDSERAWLTAEVLNFEQPQPKSNMIWIEVAINNRGKTPARVHSIVATSRLVPTPDSIADATPGKLPPYPDFSDTNRVIELREYDLVVAPEYTFGHIHVYIWPREWDQIRARKLSLHVYGTIEYSDTVKGGSHATSFCSIYAVPLPNFGEPTGFMFSLYIPAAYFRAT